MKQYLTVALSIITGLLLGLFITSLTTTAVIKQLPINTIQSIEKGKSIGRSAMLIYIGESSQFKGQITIDIARVIQIEDSIQN